MPHPLALPFHERWNWATAYAKLGIGPHTFKAKHTIAILRQAHTPINYHTRSHTTTTQYSFVPFINTPILLQ